MHLRLLPDQISHYWEYIKTAIEQTTPGVTQQGTNVILENLLAGSMQCWLMLGKEDEEFILYAVIITALFRDDFFQTQHLRICCLYGFGILSQAVWQEGFEAVRDYAKQRGCSHLEAFTEREVLAKYIEKQFQGRTDYHIIVEV